MTPYAYLSLFHNSQRVNGITGRIIRGKCDADFEKLSDDPKRKIVFLTDSNGLSQFLGRSGYDCLITVGYDLDHIKNLVSKGMKFKLVVFPETSARSGDWNGLLDTVTEVYPDLKDDCARHAAALKATAYGDYAKKLGYAFKEVKEESDPRYMTHERYVKSRRTVEDFRALLYYTMHCRELYSGDGYTYDSNGKRGLAEYVIPNKPISEIPGAIVADMNVELPR